MTEVACIDTALILFYCNIYNLIAPIKIEKYELQATISNFYNFQNENFNLLTNGETL